MSSKAAGSRSYGGEHRLILKKLDPRNKGTKFEWCVLHRSKVTGIVAVGKHI